MTFNDHRSYKTKATDFVIAEDIHLSQRAECPGTSYMAYDVTDLNEDQIDLLIEWLEDRSDTGMIYQSDTLPSGETDQCSLYSPPGHVIREPA